MTDLLNPLNPRNPSQQVSEGGKKGKKKDEKYHENREGIFLPSRGVFYLGENKGREYLNVRPLNYTDEDILTTESFYTNGTVLNELLSNVILDDFEAKDLVPIDRDTILIWLRSTAFGNQFEIEMKCPACGGGAGIKGEKKPGVLKWDLSTLEVPEYPEEILTQLINEGCVTIVTPLNQIKVKVSIPSIGRTMAFDKSYKQKKKNENTQKDFFATTSLLSVVQGVEYEEGKWHYSSMDIDAYFRKINLPISESRYIIKKASELGLRYNTAKNFVCKDCGHITEGVEMPILHKNFFWPESE